MRYSKARLNRSKNVFNNSLRANIYQFICNNPGSCICDIRNHFNIANGTIYYHLKILFRNRDIISGYNGRNKLLFPEGYNICSESLLTPKEKHIMDVIANNKELIQKDIVIKTGYPQSTVSRILQRLRIKNYVIGKFDKNGNRKYYIRQDRISSS